MLSEKPRADGGAIRLEVLLDATHPLVKLAQRIDWEQFIKQFGKLYSDEGRPGVPIRVMVGLHYLKSLYNESDESVVAKWVENPYWQYFCGCETFQHELPCHPTSLVKWRQRVGAEGMEQLLKGVLTTALSVRALPAEKIKHVIADTSVQEKAIAFPTDARLYHKARRHVVRLAKQAGLGCSCARRMSVPVSTRCIGKPVTPTPPHSSSSARPARHANCRCFWGGCCAMCNAKPHSLVSPCNRA